MSENDMHIDRAKLTTWNLNTILNLMTLVLMCVGGVAIWVNKSRDIEDLQRWRVEEKERAIQVSTELGTLRAEIDNVERKADNLDYRTTVVEQTTAATVNNLKDVQSSIGDMKGDIRVIREILERDTGGSSRKKLP